MEQGRERDREPGPSGEKAYKGLSRRKPRERVCAKGEPLGERGREKSGREKEQQTKPSAETLLTYIPTPGARPVPPLLRPRDTYSEREGELASGVRPATELKGAVTIFCSFEGI